MKRQSILVFLLMLSTNGHASEKDVTNALQTVGGIYSSIYIHEVGHALAFKAFGGTDISIEVPRQGSLLGGMTYAKHPGAGFSKTELQIISVSGLIASTLAGEAVLQNRSFHNSAYAQSILGTTVVSKFQHVFTYYTKIRGKDGYTGNDIDSLELRGGNPHLFSVALIAYSVWTLQRMRKENIPLFYVNIHF